jgi:ketosteroid isomerase-like protein
MKASPSVEAAVNGAFDKLMAAYSAGRIDEAMKYVSKDDDVTLFEPGEDMTSVGQADVRQSMQLDFDTTEGANPFTIKRQWVSAEGNVAWVNGEHSISVTVRGQSMTLGGVHTAIAKLEDGQWKFHTVHIGSANPQITQAGQRWPTQAAAGTR